VIGPDPVSGPAGFPAAPPPVGPARRRGPTSLGRVIRHRGGAAGLGLIGLLVVAAVLAPWLAPEPDQQDLGHALLTPAWAHPLGTDELGRDLWSRIVHGARISLGFAVVIVAAAAGVGLGLGLLAGFRGGLLDEAVMRLTDVLLAFPGFLLAIAIVSALGGGNLFNVALALAIYILPGFVRLTRASALVERSRDYVEAARALGMADVGIARRHVLPNILNVVLVQSSLRMGTVILLLSGFSFLGLGPRPPTPEWGLMLATGDDYLRTSPHLSLVPGTAIVLAVLGFNLVGDALRDALDPRLR
jgi:peptide/nickel transport system permease protein